MSWPELASRQIRELSAMMFEEPIERHKALTSCNPLRPPPDDPRRGLLALLSRQRRPTPALSDVRRALGRVLR
ncbi:MAG: hypothetical protein R2845_15665 [Thermomicrobiales bacterium]